jgi:serine/threonine protein kinase
VVHRDLKSMNIFCGAGMRLKIGDFGDSCMATGRLRHSFMHRWVIISVIFIVVLVIVV